MYKELYIATALETQENYCTHKFYPRCSVSHSSLAMFRSHVDIYSLCRGIFYVCVSGCMFVITRISLNRGCTVPLNALRYNVF